MTGSSKLFLVASLAMVGLNLVGCSNEQVWPGVAVAGHVTLDGKTLSEGMIRFVPIDGTPGPKCSFQIAAGWFEAPAKLGPVPGQYRIEIESLDYGGLALDDEDGIATLEANRVRRLHVVRVPERYNTSSRLLASVAENGPNEFTFELQTRVRR